ncbi:MAG TPA: gluconate 2-dehydrogenase subunit 3 family protein [Bryobacteraceae bacterium]|nr:gluconate 2-dehydrogenase subunit 3 family protein [Bryobacteraceae bacterium]
MRAQSSGAGYRYFDAATAAEVEALAEAILPGDSTPGAKEAGVIWFIDGALAGYDKNLRPAYEAGIADVQARRKRLFPNSVSVAALTPSECHSLVADLEKTEFFGTLRQHTILGFFGLPKYGGNRNDAAAKLLGIKETRMYMPPFGYYDREAAQ